MMMTVGTRSQLLRQRPAAEREHTRGRLSRASPCGARTLGHGMVTPVALLSRVRWPRRLTGGKQAGEQVQLWPLDIGVPLVP